MVGRWLAGGLAAAGVLLLGASAYGLGRSVRVPLTYQPYKTIDEIRQAGGDGSNMVVWIADISGRYDGDDEKPEGLTYSVQLPLSFAWTKQPVIALAGKTGPANSPNTHFDRLWIDWNGDRKFEDSERVPAMTDKRGAVFGPIKPVDPSGRIHPSFYLVDEQSRFRIVPAGARVGTARFGSVAMKVAILDNNLNGIYGDRSDAQEGGDAIALDLDRDGKLESVSSGSMPEGSWRTEAFPIARIIQVPGASFYRIAPSPDGQEIAIAPFTGPMGRIRTGSMDTLLYLSGSSGGMQVRIPANASIEMPAGAYNASLILYAKRDAKGVRWVAPLYLGRGKAIRVIPGSTYTVPCGPPFKANIDVVRENGALTFNVELADRGGRSVSGVYSEYTTRAAEPVLTIRRGKTVVRSLKLEYG